ncbi:MAG TPA: PilZ domain-containing protein [Phycisphaerae bacterium]|nr:PilZ domain-containing protein [Phycisphaerales bacterium]HRX86245.1 PilZ domain-containing protein [Phycisphaerae bacterium]
MDERSAATAKRIIENLQRKFWLEPTASKRAQDRKPWSVHLELAIQEPGAHAVPRKTEAVTHDLSTGGFSFITRNYVHVGAAVEATFDTVPQKPTIIGVVRNCIHLGGAMHRVGVQFTEVRRADHAASQSSTEATP